MKKAQDMSSLSTKLQKWKRWIMTTTMIKIQKMMRNKNSLISA